ncbi:DUF2157 domain-containing protein [Motilimonas eburnea]|uniref:DUF2157 domain-containing protein n=1 Tax=Motilimonas eburnea TaxID=1737488 RepID=UPI001E2D71D3|nr:DUF2157 domain-containing protein [Motilimonas eburnea]MCE2572834.1 DUF2157 domain-containing protein [Motilimonas eburnea]
MSNLSDQVWAWYQQGDIKAEQLPKALAQAEQAEPEVAWREVIDLLLLWFGVLFVSAGVIIFFAFNWQDLSKLGKFALVQGALLLCALAYGWLRWQERENNPRGLGATKANAALLGLSFMIGALLALVGQTYQTGADPWQLFAMWSLCLLPLAWLAGFDLLWLKLVALVNVSLVLYLNTWPQSWWLFGNYVFVLVAVSFVNGALYLGFYFAQQRQIQRLTAPICQSLSILLALVALTWYGCWQALDIPSSQSPSLSFYLIYAALVFGLSRFVFKQLLPLALVCFSAIGVSTVWLGVRLFDHGDELGGFFFLTFYIVAATAGISVWLTSVRGRFNADLGEQEANDE